MVHESLLEDYEYHNRLWLLDRDDTGSLSGWKSIRDEIGSVRRVVYDDEIKKSIKSGE